MCTWTKANIRIKCSGSREDKGEEQGRCQGCYSHCTCKVWHGGLLPVVSWVPEVVAWEGGGSVEVVGWPQIRMCHSGVAYACAISRQPIGSHTRLPAERSLHWLDGLSFSRFYCPSLEYQHIVPIDAVIRVYMSAVR